MLAEVLVAQGDLNAALRTKEPWNVTGTPPAQLSELSAFQ
jgi:hypothetical protein